MTINTRKPTGKPSWPILLMAGREGTGKSWSAAEASGSDLIGRTFWVGIGEDDPDEYGLIPGARFEIVEHDGTYKDILRVLTEIAAMPPTDGKPNMIVLDSMSRLWQLLSDNAQATANARAIAKARKYNKPIPNEDVSVGVDLWNVAASRWGHVMNALRAHRGPVVVTARLEQVAVMGDNGAPTTEKVWKIYGHKSLPYDVKAIVELPERGQFFITKVTSTKLQLESKREWPNFTVQKLWEALGLRGAETSDRVHAEPVVEADAVEEGERDWIEEAEKAATSAEASRVGAAAAVILGSDHEIVEKIRHIVAEKRGPSPDAAPVSQVTVAADVVDPAAYQAEQQRLAAEAFAAENETVIP